jgi:hypothetical protein
VNDVVLVNDVEMVEYHVDTSYAFDEQFALLPFGGNLSVRKPIDSKTVIFVGQDEAIFKQFLFLTKMWVGPNGERPLLPKDEGSGTMISAFVCREHGLIRVIPSEILTEVNSRRLGKCYADPDAAIEILGSADKLGTTTDVQLKMPEMIEQLISAGVTNTAGKNARQLKDLRNQSGIPKFKTVLNSIQRNRSELELDQRGKGVITKGKNKRELVELCGQHNITVMKTVEKVKEG